MNTTRFIVSTAACAALTTSVSAVTLILPIGQTLPPNDAVDPAEIALLFQDPVNGGLAWANGLTGEGIGVGSAPASFPIDNLVSYFGSGALVAMQFVVASPTTGAGGIIDVTPGASTEYITHLHSSDTCVFDESALLADPSYAYPGKIALQDLSPGEHFFNYRVTRLADGEQHFGFLKYSSNPDGSLNAIVAGFNTTAGLPASCPDGLGLVPAALGMGLVMLRHARRRRAAVQG